MPNEPVRALKAHVAIQVGNLERSLQFYERLFGAGPVKVRPGYAKFDLADPPLNFTLNEAPSIRPGALSHLGVQVESTEQVLAMRERWAQAGLQPRDEMNTECCYALQDKAWVRDPDGNEWEVFTVLEDHLPTKPAQERSCCGPACCTAAPGA